jgi:serine/threonine-protein kinase
MPAKNIGRYVVKKEIGRGGMATVFLAHDPNFDREVAVKVLPAELLHDPTFRERFEREAKTIAALDHPAIVPVYDFGQEGDQPYLVMRYMTGGSLGDRLVKGPLGVTETAHIFSRLAGALDEAHKAGIIHRDLKPGNILFDQRDDAYLADFGIAKLSESSSALTGDHIVGTPHYMSPEQARGDVKLDRRSDVYALGVILFEMLTGAPPFEGDTALNIVLKHLNEPPPSVRSLNPKVPVGAEAVVEKALAKDREARYQTASDMSLDFDKRATEPAMKKPAGLEATEVIGAKGKPAAPATTYLEEEIEPEKKPLLGKPLTWIIAAGGGLALLAVVGIAAVMLLRALSGGAPENEITETPQGIEAPIIVFSPEPQATLTSDQQAAAELFREAEALFEQGDYQAAIGLYTTAIEFDEIEADYYRRRGEAYYELGDYEAARSEFLQAIDWEPTDPLPYYDLGLLAWLVDGDLASALAYGDGLIILVPDRVEGYYLVAKANLDLGGDAADAVEALTSAIEISPADPELYHERARAHIELGQHAEALEDGNKCAELAPANYHCYWQRGIAFGGLGRVEEAVADFTLYLEMVFPDDCPECQAIAAQYIAEH